MAVEPVDPNEKSISCSAVPVTPEQLLQEVLAPVATDMEEMRLNLKNVVGQRHPMLMAAAEQIFSAGKSKAR
jgi:all-trans-nonaprenyl-diphosphate synthase